MHYACIVLLGLHLLLKQHSNAIASCRLAETSDGKENSDGESRNCRHLSARRQNAPRLLGAKYVVETTCLSCLSPSVFSCVHVYLVSAKQAPHTLQVRDTLGPAAATFVAWTGELWSYRASCFLPLKLPLHIFSVEYLCAVVRFQL